MNQSPIPYIGLLLWRDHQQRRTDALVAPFRAEMEAVRHGEGMGVERFAAFRSAVLEAYPAITQASVESEALGVIRDAEGLIDWMNARTRYQWERSGLLRSLLEGGAEGPSTEALNAVTALQLALGEYDPEQVFARPHAIPASGPSRELFDRGLAMLEHAVGRQVDPHIWERGAVTSWTPAAPTAAECAAAVNAIRRVEGAVFGRDGKPEVGAALEVTADLAGAWAVVDHVVLTSSDLVRSLVLGAGGATDVERVAAVSKLVVATGKRPDDIVDRGPRLPTSGVRGVMAAEGLGALRLHQHDFEQHGLRAESHARPFRRALQRVKNYDFDLTK